MQDLEVKLHDKFLGKEDSDAKEWQGWIDKQVCDVLTLEEGEEIRRGKPELIVPTRWVRTNKNEGVADESIHSISDSREHFALHVQFLSVHHALQTSQERVLLRKAARSRSVLGATMWGFAWFAPRQLLRARLFWLALKEHLISDGWKESVLEPALFYHRAEDGTLNGILFTHVDD